MSERAAASRAGTASHSRAGRQRAAELPGHNPGTDTAAGRGDRVIAGTGDALQRARYVAELVDQAPVLSGEQRQGLRLLILAALRDCGAPRARVRRATDAA